MLGSRKQLVLSLAVVLALPLLGVSSAAKAEPILLGSRRAVSTEGFGLGLGLGNGLVDTVDLDFDAPAVGTGDAGEPSKDEQAPRVQLWRLQGDCMPLPLLSTTGTGFQPSGSNSFSSSFSSTPADIAKKEMPRSQMVEWVVAERTLEKLTPIPKGLFHPPRDA